MKAWTFLILICAVNFAANVYVNINLANYSLENYIVMGGEPVKEIQFEGEYGLDVILDSEVMFSQEFPKPVAYVFRDYPPGVEGPSFSEEYDDSLVTYVPYYSEKQQLVLYVNGTKVAEYSFKQLCNNDGKCGGEEDYLSCPSDCGSGPDSPIDPHTVKDAIEKPSEVSPLIAPDTPDMTQSWKEIYIDGIVQLLVQLSVLICVPLLVIGAIFGAGWWFGRRANKNS